MSPSKLRYAPLPTETTSTSQFSLLAIPSPHGFVGESGKPIIFTILHDVIVIKSQYPT